MFRVFLANISITTVSIVKKRNITAVFALAALFCILFITCANPAQEAPPELEFIPKLTDVQFIAMLQELLPETVEQYLADENLRIIIQSLPPDIVTQILTGEQIEYVRERTRYIIQTHRRRQHEKNI